MVERVLLLASHAVAEYDDVRMFSDLGYDIFAPGGYEVPSRSGEGIRPPLPDAPHHPDFLLLPSWSSVSDLDIEPPFRLRDFLSQRVLFRVTSSVPDPSRRK